MASNIATVERRHRLLQRIGGHLTPLPDPRRIADAAGVILDAACVPSPTPLPPPATNRAQPSSRSLGRGLVASRGLGKLGPAV